MGMELWEGGKNICEGQGHTQGRGQCTGQGFFPKYPLPIIIGTP